MSGRDYEIDLSGANAAKLRDVLAPFVAAGRKAGGSVRTAGRVSSVPGTSTSRAGREDSRAIRDWALAQGLTVSTRGRLPAEVLEAYKARDAKPAAAEPAAAEPAAAEPAAVGPEQVAPVTKTRRRAKIKQPEFSGAE